MTLSLSERVRHALTATPMRSREVARLVGHYHVRVVRNVLMKLATRGLAVKVDHDRWVRPSWLPENPDGR